MAIWMLDGCWLGSRSTSVVWPDAAGCGIGGVEGEVWFGRLQLSDAVNTISLQGWWPLKQSSWSGKKAGPQFFGGDANLARWAVELGCFGHDSFKYSGPSTRCHKDGGQWHVSCEASDRIHRYVQVDEVRWARFSRGRD